MTLEDIYRAQVDFVWRVLRRQGVPPAEAADAIQEVFLAVHRTLARFEGRSTLTTWLYTICCSVARDRRRRAFRQHEIVAADPAATEVDRRADGVARVEHADRLAQLEQALAALAPDQREVFVLYEIEDLSGEEISAALSIPLGTVYSRLRLAREEFRRAVLRFEEKGAAPALRAGGRT